MEEDEEHRDPVERYVPPQQEGTTACVALIRGNQIIVGNIGDSRCVLSRNGQFKAGARANPTATAEARADEIEVSIEVGQRSNGNEDDDGSVNGCIGCFGRLDMFEAGQD
ncbi:putative protein phosphatase 2C 21 [Triticum urartu]|uniref:protein-serine/threonine phosphatase n=1 Tax=Triticum urartu TaxID=4572 RepID=M7YLI3_TRIUA|nr:putative protein phosphatase 2C 21 [Triticum urartu]